MTPRIIELLATTTTAGTALVAGVFFAFSSFVMPALARLPAAQGIAAMQSINVTVINRSFMTLLFGTALLCVVLAIASLGRTGEPGVWLRLLGAVAYLLGTIAVTIACNVPRNDALAQLTPDALDAAASWARFLREWTAWNHVRTASGVIAAVALLLARTAVR